MKDKSKISFKHSIIKLNFSLVCIMTVFMVINYILSQNTTIKYNNAISLYDDINEFYDYVAQANFSFKSYLYTENLEDIDTYNRCISIAQDKLKNVKDNIDDEYRWRFDLLSNMLESYQDAAKEAKDVGGLDYQVKYNELLNQFSLIEKTSTTYYEYLTDGIKSQREEIHNYENLLFIVIAIIMVAGIIWLILFSVITVRSFTQPLYQILNNIKLIKRGEYDLSSISNTSMEMEGLCFALEDMAQHVQRNIQNEKEKAALKHQLLEKENENLKKDELLALSELKLLQNQINPHFLFNTLNMIYKTAYKEKTMDTSAMVNKTSMLLRYALDKANRTSDLYSEIESIENYIYIQERRFHQRIKFVLNVEDNLPNIQVPGMLIQPLVENSVKHGLKDVIKDGEVLINVQHIDDHIVISVSDNGIGLETEILEKGILNDFHDKNKNNLGLYNVIQRIKMFYGNTAQISFNSYPGCGFEVIIEIKVEEIYVSDISCRR